MRRGSVTRLLTAALAAAAFAACGSAVNSGTATTSGVVTSTTGGNSGGTTTTTTTPTPAPTTTVQAVSVTPATGIGAGRTFTFTFSDSDRLSNIVTTEVWLGSAAPVAGATGMCDFYADASQLWLRNDANTAWLGPLKPGAADTLGNAQCTISGAASTLATGLNVVLTATVTFNASFAGAKNIYMRATDRSNVASAWASKGTYTVSALNPAYDVVTSSCLDGARDTALDVNETTQQDGRVRLQTVTPACFPEYSAYLPQEGWFMTKSAKPLPVMGRTCGHFDVLVVLIDSATNRRELLANDSLSASVKSKVSAGQLAEAMTELFGSYTTTSIMNGNSHKDMSKAIDFAFSVAVTTRSATTLATDDAGLGFAAHDAVIIIDDLRPNAGHGVERPGNYTRPLFYGKNGGYMLHLDPQALVPSLVGRELMGRNMPGGMKELQYGPTTLVQEGNTVFDRTPIINPRTGENIEPLVRANDGKVSLLEYLSGWADVDGDGIVDCIDPVIAKTADNVDGDFLPDRFDPDLSVDHRPYSWLYAFRGGVAQTIATDLRGLAYTFFRIANK